MKNKKTLITLITLYFIILPALVLGGVYAISVLVSEAVQKQVYHECIVWQGYSEEFPLYYLLDWQKKQCDDIGIEINAIVK
jgi:hypothetical protein